MGNLLAKIFNFIGNTSASLSINECSFWLLDEPEMPKSLIEK